MLDKILLYFSIIYILCFLLMCIISQFIIIKFSNKVFNILCSIFIMACCIVAFYSTDKSEGESGWDLNRYYADINAMRGKDIKYAMHNGMYKNTILTNLLFFFVSRLNNNAWLQVFSTAVSLMIFFHIIISIKTEEKYKLSTVLFYILLYFSLLSFATILLCVRWIMAISFCTLGFYKNKNGTGVIKEIICCVVAVFIHYGVIYYLFVRILSIFHSKIPSYLLLGIMLLIPLVGRLTINFPYLSSIYNKFIGYKQLTFSDVRVFIVELSVLILYCICWYIVYKKKKESNVFYRNCLAAIIGVLPVYHLFSRMLGIYTFVNCDGMMEIIDDKSNYLIKVAFSIIMIGMFTYQLVFMKSFWRFTII